MSRRLNKYFMRIRSAKNYLSFILLYVRLKSMESTIKNWGTTFERRHLSRMFIETHCLYNIYICEAKRQILFFVNKAMHNFNIRYNFVKNFLSHTFILAVFNHKTSTVILSKKINRLLRSTTQGSIHRELIKK